MPRLKNPGGVYHPSTDIDHFGNQYVTLNDPIDAFARVRVSNPTTIFDSKQIFDAQPFYWDDQETSGSSTSSTYSAVHARSLMRVEGTTAGERTRQTFMRFNYQPGKSQQIILSGVLNHTGGGTGIIQRMGYFDDDNGLFIQNNEGTIQLVRRTSVSGAAVDNTIDQANWDDPMDGTGRSGITLDFTLNQLLMIDLEWLGVGTVRFSVLIAGEVIEIHRLKNANVLNAVYMSTPNLPLRFQISNDGTGAISRLSAICGTVVSEGGQQDTGILHYASTGPGGVAASTADTVYALLGIQLKSTHLGATINLVNVSLLNEAAQDFEWTLKLNPTVASTFTYSAVTNSSVNIATGATANTVTGGTDITGGWVKSSVQGAGDVTAALVNTLRLGAAIDGTQDEIVLCGMPLANTATLQGSLSWRESP